MSNTLLAERIALAQAIEADNWYVTDRERVVGPVNTTLLLKGIAAGRVPLDSYVARYGWSNWREQAHVREVCALRRFKQAGSAPVASVTQAIVTEQTPQLALPNAAMASEQELLTRALRYLIERTRAAVGVVHQPQAPFVGLVTTCAHGPGMAMNLGEVVSSSDDARLVSINQGAAIGRPDQDGWARSSARRLGTRIYSRLSGVATVAIAIRDKVGLLELGRYDHPFRRSDVQLLSALAEGISTRFGQTQG